MATQTFKTDEADDQPPSKSVVWPPGIGIDRASIFRLGVMVRFMKVFVGSVVVRHGVNDLRQSMSELQLVRLGSLVSDEKPYHAPGSCREADCILGWMGYPVDM